MLIECPEPNCNKKYKHINGLRYHQTHAHHLGEDGEGEDNKELSSEENAPPSPASATKDEVTPMDTTSNTKGSSPQKAGKRTVKQEPISPNNSNQSSVEETNNKLDSTTTTNATSNSITSSKNSRKEEVKVTPSANNDKTAANAHVFQISSAPIGCLTPPLTVQQQSVPSTTTITSLPVSISSPVSTPSSGKDDKSKKAKGEKVDKSKTKTSAARPIAPALTPQVIALTTNVNVSHSNLASLSTHAQLSPVSPTSNLKPIQPKPTIMGDPVTVNPALSGLKEKKAKKKKSKDKDKDNVTPSKGKEEGGHDAQPVVKVEPTSVIKTACASTPSASPAKPQNTPAKTATGLDMQKHTMMGQKDSPGKLPESSRTVRPPSSLSINSPLQVNTDNREHGSDVQSPAYSDISDANESAPVLESEVQDKMEDEKSSTPVDTTKPQDMHPDQQMSAAYSMLYYTQPPYLIPAVPQASPNAQNSKEGITSSEPGKITEKGASENNTEKKTDSHRKPAEAEFKDNRAIADKKPSDGAKNPPSSQEMNEYQQQQQKMMQQQQHMQHQQHHQQQQHQQQQHQQQQHQQQQYLQYYYNSMMDPAAYQMHMMANDPHYKAQHEHEQEQYRKQHMEMQAQQQQQQKREADKMPSSAAGQKPADGSKGKAGMESSVVKTNMHPSIPASSSASSVSHSPLLPVPSSHSPQISSPQVSLKHSGTAERTVDSRPPALVSDKEKAEISLREKQNENHQILKENIELKSQMENRAKFSSHGNVAEYEAGLVYKQQEELQRFYLYQQQKLYVEEERRKLGVSEGGKHTPSAAAGAPPKKHGEMIPGKPSGSMKDTPEKVVIKKEHGHGKTSDHHGKPDSHGGSHGNHGSHSNKSMDQHHGKSGEHAVKSSDHGHSKVDMSKEHSKRDLSDSRPKDLSKDSSRSRSDDKNKSSISSMGSKEDKGISPRTTPKPPNTPVSSGTPGHPGQVPPYSQYVQHPYYGVPYDPAHPMYRGMNPMIGYATSPTGYLHPATQMRYHVSSIDGNPDKDKSVMMSPGTPHGAPSPVDRPPAKALDLLQQHASHYYNSNNGPAHKIHELQEAALADKHKASPGKTPGEGKEGAASPATAAFQKQREYSNSPPMQRHLHTHHHTHVVNPGYPIYDHYGGQYQ